MTRSLKCHRLESVLTLSATPPVETLSLQRVINMKFLLHPHQK